MTNSNNPVRNQPELEPAGTIPVVGDTVCWIRRGGRIVNAQKLISGPHEESFGQCRYMQSEIDHCTWPLDPESWSENWYWRVLKRDKNHTESTEKGDIPTENGEESPESDLFSLAMDRVGLRGNEYGEENAFRDIADQWKLYIKQRFSVEIPLTAADVPDMMEVFKLARRLVRKRAGKTRRDDNVDRLGYIYWADKLER